MLTDRSAEGTARPWGWLDGANALAKRMARFCCRAAVRVSCASAMKPGPAPITIRMPIFRSRSCAVPSSAMRRVTSPGWVVSLALVPPTRLSQAARVPVSSRSVSDVLSVCGSLEA